MILSHKLCCINQFDLIDDIKTLFKSWLFQSCHFMIVSPPSPHDIKHANWIDSRHLKLYNGIIVEGYIINDHDKKIKRLRQVIVKRHNIELWYQCVRGNKVFHIDTTQYRDVYVIGQVHWHWKEKCWFYKESATLILQIM